MRPEMKVTQTVRKTCIVIGITMVLPFPVTLVSGANKQLEEGPTPMNTKPRYTFTVKEALHHAREANAVSMESKRPLLMHPVQRVSERAKEGSQTGQRPVE